jgi:hypothetical protein
VHVQEEIINDHNSQGLTGLLAGSRGPATRLEAPPTSPPPFSYPVFKTPLKSPVWDFAQVMRPSVVGATACLCRRAVGGTVRMPDMYK